MEGITIVKLLSYHFKDDGRTLVRLSHINRVWRTLLRRDPDGELFVFCKHACERVCHFDMLPPTNDYINIFLCSVWPFPFQMLQTLVSFSVEDLNVRTSVKREARFKHAMGMYNIAMEGEIDSKYWSVEASLLLVKSHYRKWIWEGFLHKESWLDDCGILKKKKRLKLN